MAGRDAGTLTARRLLKTLDAAVVVGFGGYPSVPPVLAARTLARRPAIVLQEQNAVLGARQYFPLPSRRLYLRSAWPGTRRIPASVKTSVTGNPVRSGNCSFGRQHLHATRTLPSICWCWADRLGARVFSDVVPEAIAALPADVRIKISIVQQCRAEDIDRVRAAYDACGVIADLGPFFDDVAGKLDQVHLVIARAGASTVAELAAIAGRPGHPRAAAGCDRRPPNRKCRLRSAAPASWCKARLPSRSTCLASDDAVRKPRGAHTIRARKPPRPAAPTRQKLLADLVESHVAVHA